MKYKLIHTDTDEIHLCDKIVIDGFDYYTVDFDENLFVIGNYILFKNIILNSDEVLEIKAFNEGVLPGYLHKYGNSLSTCYNVRIGHYLSFPEFLKDCKHVIATNNPNIDIPKAINEVERLKLVHNEGGNKDVFTTGVLTGIEIGYNKSQETHPFSEEDVEFFIKKSLEDAKKSVIWSEDYYKHLTKELIQLWKEQKPKTIYFK